MVTGLFCLYSVVVYNLTAIKWVALIYAITIAWYVIEGRKDIRPFEEEFGLLGEL